MSGRLSPVIKIDFYLPVKEPRLKVLVNLPKSLKNKAPM